MVSFLYLLINFKWKWFPFNVICIVSPVPLMFLNCLYLPAYTVHMLSVWKSPHNIIFVIYGKLQKSRCLIQFGKANLWFLLQEWAAYASVRSSQPLWLVGWTSASILTHFIHDNCAAVHRILFLDKNWFFLSEVMISTGPTTPQATLCTSILSTLAHVIHTTYTDIY